MTYSPLSLFEDGGRCVHEICCDTECGGAHRCNVIRCPLVSGSGCTRTLPVVHLVDDAVSDGEELVEGF